MKVTETAYSELERTLCALFKQLKQDIGDEYRASEEDTLPSMQVTVGATPKEDGSFSWSYQTGDNSYSGGAYLHAHWGVVSLYRRSDCAQLAKECVGEIGDSIANSEL